MTHKTEKLNRYRYIDIYLPLYRKKPKNIDIYQPLYRKKNPKKPKQNRA